MNLSANLPPRTKVLFLSDLDGTWLSKTPENRARLDKEIVEIKDEYQTQGVDLEFGYVTARPPQRVEKENLPLSDWTVTYNGAEIHNGDPGDFAPDGSFTKNRPLDSWVEKNGATGFSATITKGAIETLLNDNRFANLEMKTVGEVVEDPAADANEFTSAFCFELSCLQLTPGEKVDLDKDGTPDILEKESFSAPQQLTELTQCLNESLDVQGVGHEISPVYLFHGKPYVMFDVASPLANKGEAVSFLQDREGVSPDHTIVAGDGGNDIVMMTGRNGTDEGRRVVVVGGNSKLVDAASGLRNAVIQPGEMDCSLGVLSGLRHHLDEIVEQSAI